MKRKLISLALALSLVLSLCPWAMAADTRETDFFEDQPHTELSFDEIEYKHMEAEPILAVIEEIRGLMADANNADAVAEKFDSLTDQLMELMTMYSLSNIRICQDVNNESYEEEFNYTYGVYLDAADAFGLLLRDLLDSPCGTFLTGELTGEDLAYYRDYEAMTEEEKNLNNQELDLVLQYKKACTQAYTVEHQGQAYDDDALGSALLSGAMDEDTYLQLSREIAKARNAALGGIYMDMIAVRAKIAKNEGYSNYGDYAYAEIYDRDYTQEDIRTFHQAVKDYMVPINTYLSALTYYQSDDSAFLREDYADVSADMIAPYIGQMSSELKEALDYMTGHKMYDVACSETKQGSGFTTMLYSYGAPFMFNNPVGDLYDFCTMVHELGHYNNFYWDDASWNASSDNIDTAEVHSQGLELLFSHYYPQIFGTSAAAARDYLMTELTGAIIQGCLHDELQQYVYATPNVTLKQINQEFCKLAKEYGLVAPEDERTELYDWEDVYHTFESPMYYISYAVSAAGAFDFWLSAQEGKFEDAVDQYLAFVALPPETGFQASFEAMKMSNPLSEEFIAQLAQELLVKLDVEKRLSGAALAFYFTDLEGAHWYDEYVLTMVMAGLISGYNDGSFRPEATATWGQALKLVLMLAGCEEQTPVEDGHWASGYLALAQSEGLVAADAQIDLNAAIDRTAMCHLLAKALGIPAAETESPFNDTDDGYVLALAELGVINGYENADGTCSFRGDGSLTRAQLCKILYCTAEVLVAMEQAA